MNNLNAENTMAISIIPKKFEDAILFFFKYHRLRSCLPAFQPNALICRNF